MFRKGKYFIMPLGWAVLRLLIAALSTIPPAHSGGRIWLVGEPSPGMPTCEEFYDKWEAPGAPPGILAMAGYSREIFAAKDCLDKNDVPKACEHWSKLLIVLDKLGPPLNGNRGDIEELMRQKNCDATMQPESPSQSKSSVPPEAPQNSTTAGPRPPAVPGTNPPSSEP